MSQLNTAHFSDLQLVAVVYPTAEYKYTSGYLIHIEKQIHKLLNCRRIRKDREWFTSENIWADIKYVTNHMNDLGIDTAYTTNGDDLLNVKDILLSVVDLSTNVDKVQTGVDMSTNVETDVMTEIENLDRMLDCLFQEDQNDQKDQKEESIIMEILLRLPDEDELLLYNYEPIEEIQIVEQKSINCEPRPYQLVVMDKLENYYCNNTKGMLILPPGYGKSYIAGFYIRKFKRVLVLTPQIQISYDFESAMLACNINVNTITSETPDSYKNQFHVTITTYQSYLNNKKTIDEIEYDFVIYDEAHHLCSDKFRTSIEIKHGRKLFMTATKRVTYDDESVFDMNHADFGDVIYEQTLEDCILKGMLCDYKLYACDWKEGLISVME
jgi:predicted helicase